MLRISMVGLSLGLLDEHDAPQVPDPITFTGDKDSTAVEKAIAFLGELPDKLNEAKG